MSGPRCHGGALLLSLGLLGVLGPACWLRLGGGYGTVAFNWTFNGGQGCTQAGVTEVTASIGGQSASFACDDAIDGGRTGELTGVPFGTQSFTLTGVGPVFEAGASAPQPLYQLSATLDVAEESANETPVIDLPLLPGIQSQQGDLELLWSFGGRHCADVGDPAVTVEFMNGFAGGTFPCQAGGLEGTRFTGLGVGVYSVTLAEGTELGDEDGGVDAGNFIPEASASPQIYVNGIDEASLQVDLEPPVNPPDDGGAEEGTGLVLTFTFGPDGGTCEAAGIDELVVSLLNVGNGGSEVEPDGGELVFYLQSPLLTQTLSCVGTPSLTVLGYPSMDGACIGGPCALEASDVITSVQGLSGGIVRYALHDAQVWAGTPSSADDPSDVGVTSTYVLNVPPVASGAQ